MIRNKIILIGLTLFIFNAFCVTASAQERGAGNKGNEKRLALVIGNGNYKHTSPLNNPVNDATDISITLKDVGFDVISGTNQTLPQMRKLIREFGAKLKQNGGVGLFYYAGHGIQVNGRNFLIPVDADIVTEVETEDFALDVNSVLRQMDAAGNGVNIVILDACRNNPFARSWNRNIGAGGLAQINAPNGTFIAYATAPDTTASDGPGRNGLYTTELLKYLKKPDLKIEEVFKEVTKAVNRQSGGKQVPWVSSSLPSDFYFVSNGKIIPPVEEDPTIELSFWNSIKNSTDPRDFKEYLDRFPNGQFAGIAKRRIQSTPPIKQPPVTPQTWIVDSSLFTFELKQCRLSGTKVFCDLTVVNNDRDKNLSISKMSSFLIDDANNHIKATRVELANATNTSMSSRARTLMVTGVKTSARIVFENVSVTATKAELISISAGADNVQNFKIEYRNIPLKDLARSITDPTTDSDEPPFRSQENSQLPTNRANNTRTFEVRPGRRWIDSGLNVSPGMKVEVTVTGGIQIEVDNSAYGNVLGSVLKKRIKIPPGNKTIGGKALITKIKYQSGGESRTLTVGDNNILRIENDEYGRLYFAIDRKYASGKGTLSVTLKW